MKTDIERKISFRELYDIAKEADLIGDLTYDDFNDCDFIDILQAIFTEGFRLCNLTESQLIARGWSDKERELLGIGTGTYY